MLLIGLLFLTLLILVDQDNPTALQFIGKMPSTASLEKWAIGIRVGSGWNGWIVENGEINDLVIEKVRRGEKRSAVMYSFKAINKGKGCG